MKLKAIIILSIFSLQSFYGQTVNTTLNSNVRDITELDIGFNRRSDKGNWWTDASFKNLVSEMNPDVVRYPAGTQANYWDWRTGRFLENVEKPWYEKEILKIPGFIAVLPNKTKAVYVINMARPTPATGVDVNASEKVLKSDATLLLKINDYLEAIKEFNDQGKLPFAVEFGNEFYFGNDHSGIYQIIENNGKFYSGWDTNNDRPFESVSKADATEVIAAFYLKHCKTIAAAIKEKYPSIKIVITTTKEGYATRVAWNSTIFNTLKNNSNYSEFKNNIYAVTQHHYLNDSYGIQTVISDNSSAKRAIAEGIQYPIEKISDYNLVSNDYKIWYTEFGEVKEIAEETWASGVRYAALIYSFINLGDKVGQLDWHFISDNNVVKVGDPYKLAPVGIASKLVSKAFSGMDKMQKIQFTNNTTSVGNVKSLYGYKLKNSEKETLLIINTNSVDFSNVNFSTLFTYSGQPKMTQYYSDAPYISNVYEGHSNIVSSATDVNNSVVIKKFSITVIESKNTALSTDDYLVNSLELYPNPASTEVFINTKNPINLISIYNTSGKLVDRIFNISNSKINIENLNSGLYFFKVETTKNSVFRKLIKK